MVQIGTIEYEAKVTGAAEAQSQTEDLQESQEDLAESSEESATSLNGFAGSIRSSGDASTRTGRQTGVLDHSLRLLGSTAHFVGGAIVGLVGKVTGLGGVMAAGAKAVGVIKGALAGLTLKGMLGSVVGALKGFGAWLAAGSAGALAFAGAIGAGLGLLGVWILEVTGALDAVRNFGAWVGDVLPGWVRDGLLQVLSIGVGPLAALGGFITGFIQGGFSEGFAQAREVMSIFGGAWRRQIGRISDVFWGGVDRIKSGWSSIRSGARSAIDGTRERFFGFVEGVRGRWDSFVAGTVGRFNEGVEQIRGGFVFLRESGIQAISQIAGFFIGGITGIRERFTGAFDTVDERFSGLAEGIQERVEAIPGDIRSGLNRVERVFTGTWEDIKDGVTGFLGDIEDAATNTVRAGFNAVVPDEVSIPSVTLSAPSWAGGMSTTIGGQSLDLPQLQVGGRIQESGAAVVHEGEAVIPEPIVSAAERGGGDGDDGGGVTVEDMTLIINADTFDPTDLSRRDIQELADRLTKAMGRKTSSRAGTR